MDEPLYITSDDHRRERNDVFARRYGEEGPGRCATGAGAVLVGFGIDAALRLARERFAPRFRNSVHFHSWVEAG